MSFFGKFACVSIAAITLCASTPALAAANTRAVHVWCDGDSLAAFCTALGTAISDAHTGLAVLINPNTSNVGLPTLTIRFEPIRQSAQALSGLLSWRDSHGRTGAGPEIELSAVDAAISADMLSDYARTLVRHTHLPL